MDEAYLLRAIALLQSKYYPMAEAAAKARPDSYESDDYSSEHQTAECFDDAYHVMVGLNAVEIASNNGHCFSKDPAVVFRFNYEQEGYRLAAKCSLDMALHDVTNAIFAIAATVSAANDFAPNSIIENFRKEIA
jgi:hypothetical protein